jgi:hypothetical protein
MKKHVKIFWATLSLFCVTSTLVANAEQTAEGYLDQYLEENKENLSQKEIDLFSKYREEIISILGISLNNSPEIRIEDFLANALEGASNAMTATMNGDWMWFGAFPWVYSSKYESWLYLYPNLDVSIYGENGYTRKDSNYCTRMNWVWVVREDGGDFVLRDSEYQSKFAYSDDEKAWLHFKQRDGEELYCYSVERKVWKNFGGEMFDWLDFIDSIERSAITSISIGDLHDDIEKANEGKTIIDLDLNSSVVDIDDLFGEKIGGVEIEPANAYKPGDVITLGTKIKMRGKFMSAVACPVCAEPTFEEDEVYDCSCKYEEVYSYYYRSPTTSEIENQQIEGYYYVLGVKYLGSSPYLDPNVLVSDNDTVLNPKVEVVLDPTKVSINKEILIQTSTIKQSDSL